MIRNFAFPSLLSFLILSAAAACGGEIEPSSREPTASTPTPESPGLPNTNVPSASGDVEIDSQLKAIAVDEKSIYVIDLFGRVLRLPKSGGGPVETLHAPEAAVQHPGGLLVDDTFLYWTTLGFDKDTGRVVRMPKAGGEIEVIASGQSRPWGLAIDSERVYWANEGNTTTTEPNTRPSGSIMSALKRGASQAESDLTVVAKEQRRPIAIAIDADTVYFSTGPWGSNNGTVARVAKTGGASSVLADGRNHIPSMAVDGGRVVWTEHGNLIATVPIGGGSIVEIHKTADVGEGIAAAAGNAYFGLGRHSATLRASGDGAGTVTRDVAKMTFPPDANLFIATSIALDETRVFWFDYWWSYSSPKHHAIIRSAAR